jgi:hypothetical protein
MNCVGGVGIFLFRSRATTRANTSMAHTSMRKCVWTKDFPQTLRSQHTPVSLCWWLNCISCHSTIATISHSLGTSPRLPCLMLWLRLPSEAALPSWVPMAAHSVSSSKLVKMRMRLRLRVCVCVCVCVCVFMCVCALAVCVCLCAHVYVLRTGLPIRHFRCSLSALPEMIQVSCGA